MKCKIYKSTQILFSVCLPILTLSLVTLLISYLIACQETPLTANTLYPAMLEYIIASLAILIGGGLLSEFLNRENEKTK